MAWKRSPPELVAAFEKAAPKDPRAVRRPMFGYPALFVNGNMFAGTFQDRVMVRLPEDQRKGLRPFEPMPGRPMKDYAVLPPEVVGKPATLRAWIARAMEYTATLPPKKK